MATEMEALIASCNSMKTIRKCAECNPSLEDAYTDPLQSSNALLQSLFSRLCLKDQKVQTLRLPHRRLLMVYGKTFASRLLMDTTETVMHSKMAFKQFCHIAARNVIIAFPSKNVVAH